eukprot:gene4222-biopygen2754
MPGGHHCSAAATVSDPLQIERNLDLCHVCERGCRELRECRPVVTPIRVSGVATWRWGGGATIARVRDIRERGLGRDVCVGLIRLLDNGRGPLAALGRGAPFAAGGRRGPCDRPVEGKRLTRRAAGGRPRCRRARLDGGFDDPLCVVLPHAELAQVVDCAAAHVVDAVVTRLAQHVPVRNRLQLYSATLKERKRARCVGSGPTNPINPILCAEPLVSPLSNCQNAVEALSPTNPSALTPRGGVRRRDARLRARRPPRRRPSQQGRGREDPGRAPPPAEEPPPRTGHAAAAAARRGVL